jgi:hypothetical protein
MIIGVVFFALSHLLPPLYSVSLAVFHKEILYAYLFARVFFSLMVGLNIDRRI